MAPTKAWTNKPPAATTKKPTQKPTMAPTRPPTAAPTKKIFATEAVSNLLLDNLDLANLATEAGAGYMNIPGLDFLDLRRGRIQLPPIFVQETVLRFPLELNLTKMLCQDIDFGEFTLDFEELDTTAAFRAIFRLQGMDLSCTVDFETSWVIFSGNGKVHLLSKANQMETQMLFQPPPVTTSKLDKEENHRLNDQYNATNEDDEEEIFSIEECNTQFRVTDLFFEQSENLQLAIFVLNALEFIIQDAVESAMDRVGCEIVMATQGMVQNLLKNVTQVFRPFMNEQPASIAEENTTTGTTTSIIRSHANNVTLVNYNHPNSLVARVLSYGIKTMGTILGKSVPSDQAVSSPNRVNDDDDLFINTAMRSFLDPEDGSFIFPLPESGMELLDSEIIKILGPEPNLTSSNSTDNTRNNTRIMTMDIPGAAYKLFGITKVKINAVQIYGLDNFRSFAGGLTNTTGNQQNQTVHVQMALSSLSVVVHGQIEIEAPSSLTTTGDDKQQQQQEPVVNATTEVEPFVVHVGVTDLNASASILLALDEASLSQLRVGKLLRLQDILCQGFPAIQDFQLLNIILDDSMAIHMNMSSTNKLNDETAIMRTKRSASSNLVSSALNSGIMEFGLALYEDVLIQSAPQLMREILPALVQGIAEDFANSTCSNNAPVRDNNSHDHVVDFRDLLLPSERALEYGATGLEPYGNLVPMAKQFIDKNLLIMDEGSTTGLLKINNGVIKALTEQQTGVSGKLIFNGTFAHVEQSIVLGEDLNMSIRAGVSDVRIENLDTFSTPTAFLDPKTGTPSFLYNMAQLGLPASPIRLRAELMVGVSVNNETTSHNHMELEVETDSIALLATAAVKLVEDSFLNFPIDDVLDLQCWLASLAPTKLNSDGKKLSGTQSSLFLPELDVLVGDFFRFDLSCIECSGPTAEWVVNLTNTLDDEDSLISPNEIIKAGISLLINGEDSVFQTQVDRMLADAPQFCRHHRDYNPNMTSALRPVHIDISHLKASKPEDESHSFLVAVLALGGLAILGFAAAVVVLYVALSLHYRSWLANLPHQQVMALKAAAQKEHDRQRRRDLLAGPMFLSKQIPLFMKVLVPIALLASAGLFLCGILSSAVMVKLNAMVGGLEVYEADLPFTVANVAMNAWALGGRALALFVIAGSGMWPQVKQFGTIALWFLPTSFLPIRARGMLLHIFDFLGKWTMASVFLFFISMAVFRFEITSPQYILSGELYRVDILMVPDWGLYATSIAHVMALTTSRICIHYHERIVASSTSTELSKEEETENVKEGDNHHLVASIDAEHGSRSELVPQATTTQGASYNPGCCVFETSIMSQEATEVSIAAGEEQQVVVSSSLSSQEEEDGDDCQRNVWIAKPRFLWFSAASTRGTTSIMRIAITGGMASLVVGLVAAGCLVPSFSRDIRGFAGLLMDMSGSYGSTHGSESFSVFSTIARFMHHARLLNSPSQFVGHLWLAALLVLTVFMVPIIEATLLLVYWFWPQPNQEQPPADKTKVQIRRRRLAVALQILQSCQSMEVFLLSAIMFALELGGITNMVAPSVCQPVERLTENLALYGVLEQDDTMCFSYNGSIQYGSLLLLLAVLALYGLTMIVLWTTRRPSLEGDTNHPIADLKEEAPTKQVLAKVQEIPFFLWVFRRLLLSTCVVSQEEEQDTDDSDE